MIRVVLVHVLLFAVPFMLYALILVARGEPVDAAASWRRAPLTVLALAGAGLVAAGLIALASFGTGDTDRTYVPSAYEDGKFVPGHFE